MQQSSSNSHGRRSSWNEKTAGGLKPKTTKFSSRTFEPEVQRPRPHGLQVGFEGRKKHSKKYSDWQDDSGLDDSVESARIDISKAYHSCVSNYSKIISSRRNDGQTINELDALEDFNVGSSCSIYVTEISSPNLFLGIENNKQLKLSFQSLKKKLEICARGLQGGNQSGDFAPVVGQETLQNPLGCFVCVNDQAEGFSRGYVVSNVNQICDVYLIDWGYINTYQVCDMCGLSTEAFEFCRPLAQLFEIAGSPTDLPFPEGLSLPALFHVKVMAAQKRPLDPIVVKVKYRGRDLIDYYYEPALLKQMEEAAAGHQQQQLKSSHSGGGDTWTVGHNRGGSQGGAGGDESSSATNSVVEEWLLNTADEQFSHFDEGPPSPTDDEALANLMEVFDLGDSVSAVVNQPQQQQQHHFNSPLRPADFQHQQKSPTAGGAPNAHPSGGPRFVSNYNAVLPAASGNIGAAARMTSPYHQRQQQPAAPNPSPQTRGPSLPSISSLLQIKAGSTIQIFISYVVLPTFFNFIPINSVSTGLREKLNSLLTTVITDTAKTAIRTEPSSGRPVFTMGQFFVASVRGEARRVTVKPGHTGLEQSGFLKLQDVDYGGEVVIRSEHVYNIPADAYTSVATIPVLRCNGAITALHPNSANRRWTPEQCQVFRHLTENCTLTATVMKVSMSPQMSVPYYNFELFSHEKNVAAISDVMRAFEYAAATASTTLNALTTNNSPSSHNTNMTSCIPQQ